MRFLLSTLSYALLCFGLSALAVIATHEATPPAEETFSEPEDVTRADGWPESKAAHMQEGDFWYWVEQQYAAHHDALPDLPGVTAIFTAGTKGSPFTHPALDDFHELDAFLWCVLLPVATFLVLGGGASLWAPLGLPAFAGALALNAAVVAYALQYDSWGLYHLLWDVSIYWTNGLGWTYYDFNVRFFIYAPAAAMGTGLLLMGARAVRVLRARRAPSP